MLRLSLFLIIVFGLLHTPWFLWLPFLVIYSFLYRCYEILIFAACVDAYYGTGIMSPFYVLIVLGVMFVTELIRPRLNINNYNSL